MMVLQFASQKMRFFEDLDCSIEAQSLGRCGCRTLQLTCTYPEALKVIMGALDQICSVQLPTT
jgi:hypothetical protein